jgi:hypothetical protein
MTRRATLELTESSLTADEQAFLDRARRKYLDNAGWLEFEEFAFGSRSPLFSSTRSQRDVLTHPLYAALKEMWLELGVRQGRIASPAKGRTTDATGRKTRGSR